MGAPVARMWSEWSSVARMGVSVIGIGAPVTRMGVSVTRIGEWEFL